MKTVFTLLVVAVLGTGAWFFYKIKTADPLNNFRTVTVKRGDVTSTISATGTVEAEDFLDVGAQVQGRIIDFGVDPSELKGRKPKDILPAEKAKLKRVDFNSVVHPETILAYIDDAVYKAQWLQADATVNRNIADLVELKAKRQQTAADWARAKRLRPDLAAVEKDDPANDDAAPGNAANGTKAPAGKATPQQKAVAADNLPAGGSDPYAGTTPGIEYRAMSDTDYDVARANYEVAKAYVLVGEKTIDQSVAARDMAKTNLDYCTISSPIEGTVIARRVNIGQTVVAALNAPSIFLIAKDLTKMQVWASVNEADIGTIRSRKDMPARFTIDTYPGETFYGKVTQVRLNAQSTQNVVLYTVVVTFDNSDLRLIPYLTANLQFEVEQRQNVLLVPNVAIRWNPRKEQIAPDIRDSVAAVASGSSGKGGGKKSGKGGGKDTPAGQDAGKEASPGQGGGPQTQAGQATGAEAQPPANPSEAAKSAKPAQGPTDRKERGRLWVQDGNFVRPVDVRLGVTDGVNTEVSGSKLQEGIEVVVGEARNDQAGDAVDNPFAPKLFRGGQQKSKDSKQQ
jgi:HlyD family secretion protein